MKFIAVAFVCVLFSVHPLFAQEKENFLTDKRQRIFRVYDDNKYRVIDPTLFYIYSREVNVVNGKEKTRQTKYYFSVDGSSEIKDLTIINLKKAFPSDHEFHDLLDIHFKQNGELIRYDKFRNEYKVKSIFRKTVAVIIK